MGKQKYNTEIFIKMAKAIHEERFDYSMVKYTKSSNKILIRCVEHDYIFETMPAFHLKSKSGGCKKCSGSYSKTVDEWIEKAKTVHNNKYDYSKVEYCKSDDVIEIICPEHGVFKQRAKLHISGTSCPACSGKKKHTNETFIQKAKEVHGDKYNYGKVEYKNAHEKVCIICPSHGEFWQKPNNHISGRKGCVKCAHEAVTELLRDTKESFILKAMAKHGEKFDYSEVVYVDNSTKIKIKCNKCGLVFWQKPANHSYLGQGCPSWTCNPRSKPFTKEVWVEKARIKHGNKYNYDKVVYKDINTHVEIICNKCNKSFWQTPHSHSSGAGCHYCNFSNGETAISVFLDNHNILAIAQEWFKDSASPCINKETKQPLRFDFYLPDYNTCIEFDGKQHYVSVDYFGGEKELLKRNYLDNLKTQYCLDNNIKLIRIPYWDIKNINEIFLKELELKND